MIPKLVVGLMCIALCYGMVEHDVRRMAKDCCSQQCSNDARAELRDKLALYMSQEVKNQEVVDFAKGVLSGKKCDHAARRSTVPHHSVDRPKAAALMMERDINAPPYCYGATLGLVSYNLSMLDGFVFNTSTWFNVYELNLCGAAYPACGDNSSVCVMSQFYPYTYSLGSLYSAYYTWSSTQLRIFYTNGDPIPSQPWNRWRVNVTVTCNPQSGPYVWDFYNTSTSVRIGISVPYCSINNGTNPNSTTGGSGTTGVPVATTGASSTTGGSGNDTFYRYIYLYCPYQISESDYSFNCSVQIVTNAGISTTGYEAWPTWLACSGCNQYYPAINGSYFYSVTFFVNSSSSAQFYQIYATFNDLTGQVTYSNLEVVNVIPSMNSIELYNYTAPSVVTAGNQTNQTFPVSFILESTASVAYVTIQYSDQYGNYLAYQTVYVWGSYNSTTYYVSAYMQALPVPTGIYCARVYAYDVYYNFIGAANGTCIEVISTGCDAGSYARLVNGTYVCEFCPQGFYSSSPDSLTCQACPAGSTSSCALGSTSCIACPAGTSSHNGRCEKCAAGTYNAYSGSIRCNSCPAGQYANQTGSTYCNYCQYGTYSCAGASYCQYCRAGTFSLYGSEICEPCAQGAVSSYPGASYCWQCPANTYSSAAGDACLPCPAGQSSPAGSYRCF